MFTVYSVLLRKRDSTLVNADINEVYCISVLFIKLKKWIYTYFERKGNSSSCTGIFMLSHSAFRPRKSNFSLRNWCLFLALVRCEHCLLCTNSNTLILRTSKLRNHSSHFFTFSFCFSHFGHHTVHCMFRLLTFTFLRSFKCESNTGNINQA